MDEGVARHLLNAVAAARILGAEVILTGLTPATAQALTLPANRFRHGEDSRFPARRRGGGYQAAWYPGCVRSRVAGTLLSGNRGCGRVRGSSPRRGTQSDSATRCVTPSLAWILPVTPRNEAVLMMSRNRSYTGFQMTRLTKPVSSSSVMNVTAACGAGPLSADDDACVARTASVGHAGDLRRIRQTVVREPLAQVRQRVCPRAVAGGTVVPTRISPCRSAAPARGRGRKRPRPSG